MSPSDPSREAESLLAEFNERLQPDGWSVALMPRADGFVIVIDHPLSHTFRVGFTSTTDSIDRGYVEAFFRRPELARIARRPAAVPHASLIGRIRTAAAAGRWPDDVVETLARVLASEALVTDDEADWLAAAGAAWSEST